MADLTPLEKSNLITRNLQEVIGKAQLDALLNEVIPNEKEEKEKEKEKEK